MMALMATRPEVTGPVNIGNPGEFTIRELAEEVVRQTGGRSRFAHKPLPMNDPRQRKPDISLARQLLGWEPATPLEEGLVPTIAYFRDLIARADGSPGGFAEPARMVVRA